MCVVLSVPYYIEKSGAFRAEYLCALLEEIWGLNPSHSYQTQVASILHQAHLQRGPLEGLIFFDTTS